MVSTPPAEPEHWTTEDVGEFLGYPGPTEKRIRSAASWLYRAGIAPVGRQPGRSGQNLYDADTVQSAKAAMPGRGNTTDG